MGDGFSMTDAPTPEKRPLFRPLPPPADYPTEALGPLRSAAEAIQQRTQAPIAMCGQSVLAAATLAVQAHRDVELPGGGRKPLTGIFVSVADSGERKTSIDRIALAAVYRIEERWRAEHSDASARYMNDREAWKEARDSSKRKAKGDRGLIRDTLNAIGPEPKAPPHPMLLLADPTPEALVLHLAESRPWCGLFTAEGGILLGGVAFSDESRMRTGALLNCLWDGEPIRRRRVGTGIAFLAGRRCSVHAMMQPPVAKKLFGDEMLEGIGLLARTLLVAPASTAGTRRFRSAPAECRAALDAYNARLEALLDRPPATRPDDAQVLEPPVLTLSDEAREVWIAFHDHAEGAIAAGAPWHSIRAFGAKAAEHAGRLAAVLTAFADPDAMEVSAEAMACGITLTQYYAHELIRLQGAAAISSDLQLAARLLGWWQRRAAPHEPVHLAGIYQRGLNAIGDAMTARRIIAILDDHGWVTRCKSGVVIDGVARQESWRLLP